MSKCEFYNISVVIIVNVVHVDLTIIDVVHVKMKIVILCNGLRRLLRCCVSKW